MKKKVGIITIHKSPVNFGAVLQCYALWKYIENQGYDCEIIDLVRPWSKKYIKSSLFKEKSKEKNIYSIKKIIKKILLFKENSLTEPYENNRFKEFNGLMRYSKQYCCVDDLYQTPPIYDIYISGSDQIWNPTMPFINEPYFLTFVPKGKRKISYASSFAITELPLGIWKNYGSWLKDYKKISVRESSGINIVKKEFGCNAVVVLDPTMLFSSEEWSSLFITPQDKSKYIVLYLLHYNQIIISNANRLAKKYNLKLKVLVANLNNYKKFESKELDFCEVGPKEWMGYIYNAEYVITDSFHGSVFSIIFGKTFITISTNNNVSDRINTLVSTFELEQNFVNIQVFSCVTSFDSYNYNKEIVARKIAIKREESMLYLNDALN